MGLSITALTFVFMDKSRMHYPSEAAAALLARGEVTKCHNVTGNHDFLL